MMVGHLVAVPREGARQRVTTPEELYARPVNTFVASFFGSPAITMVESTVREGIANAHGAKVPLDRDVAARHGEKGVIGLRADSRPPVAPGKAGAPPPGAAPGGAGGAGARRASHSVLACTNTVR